MAYSTPHQAHSEHMFRIETGWTTPPTSADGSMSRDPSISTGLSMLGVDDRAMHEHDPMSAPPELYSSTMPWTPPTDFPFAEVPISTAHMTGAHMRSQSFDVSMATPMPWSDPAAHDMVSYSQVPTPASGTTNFFPSPTATPTMRPTSSRQKSSSSLGGGSCNCFTVCLQSLQALHNASSPALPPFDVVLSVNSKAVEGCAAMLACNRCFSRSGTQTATMLLATVIGKITSFYKNASFSYLDTGSMGFPYNTPGGPLGVSLGVYQLNGEDGKWFELEILARELRKLEEVYAKFRDVCHDVSDDQEVTNAMLGYLGQNLDSTLEVLNHRKGDMTFVA
ncbi:Uu.00g099970.m01.CDS01 [Anthostomella pinea]|uniref:Uu.00g099970.m01.CDS01 n=1 Tax=Anthostomella pinea TaxID=933095 RepID=A0AAI8VCZ9_9PEZI|nr:Uu.00g099970.m01.CDS01 [Anthostomella pinea]